MSQIQKMSSGQISMANSDNANSSGASDQDFNLALHSALKKSDMAPKHEQNPVKALDENESAEVNATNYTQDNSSAKTEKQEELKRKQEAFDKAKKKFENAKTKRDYIKIELEDLEKGTDTNQIAEKKKKLDQANTAFITAQDEYNKALSEFNDVRVNVGFDDNIFLDGTAHNFETGATKLMEMLKEAQTAMENDPSNPSMLAAYQAKLQAYTLFRNAQTSTVKVYKDTGSAIVQNFR